MPWNSWYYNYFNKINIIHNQLHKENHNFLLNFYLAHKLPNTYSYYYIDLQRNIDPIFESFNIALDRINQYGIDEDE